MPATLGLSAEPWVKVAYSPTLHRAGELLNFFPGQYPGGVPNSPSPLAAMLTSGLLGAGLGWAGFDQEQVVIHQSRGQGHRHLTPQGATTTDHPHAPIIRHLQIGARQTAGLPETLNKVAGPIGVAAAQGQQPAGPGSRGMGIQQGHADFRSQPAGQFALIIESCRCECTIA